MLLNILKFIDKGVQKVYKYIDEIRFKRWKESVKKDFEKHPDIKKEYEEMSDREYNKSMEEMYSNTEKRKTKIRFLRYDL